MSYCKENILKNFSIGNLYDLCNDDNKDENRTYKPNKIVSSIRKNFIEGNLDFLISNYIEKEEKDLLFKEDNIIYEISSTLNQKKHKNDNISSINLGKCEARLREDNKINDNITLLVLKVDIFQEGVLIPFIEYEVYNSETKVKLDLSACKDIKIEISIPVSINESELFKYDISSDYYNDICFSYQEKNKADMIINDRRNEYLNNNLSVCEENC